MKIPYKYYLTQDEIPREWYNIRADMKEPLDPMLHPGTHEAIPKEAMYGLFSQECVEQEFDSANRFIPIPEPVLDYYLTFRPAPLVRAYNLEKALDTPAKIFYKFEGNNTSGSHKLNSAAAQVYYAKQQGITKLTTETGAGQWGTALAMACAHFGVELTVFMVKVSYEQKVYRKAVMQAYGAEIFPSPSDSTNVGRDILKRFPDTLGSLGCAISEAMEVATGTENCRYSLGSVMNHVLLHQSIIGLETRQAMVNLDQYPDIVIGCAGGGSNLGGLMAAFMQDKLTGKAKPYFIAVEPASCPTLTRGKFAYDFGDTGRMTPLIKMYTLGSDFMPSANHAGGLRFHGMSPILSRLYHDRVLDEARVAEQTKVFDAAVLFARTEMVLPAPESSHAIAVAIDEAKKCKESGESKTILFGLSGTGYFDMTAYTSYFDGSMSDYIPSDDVLRPGIEALPKV